MPDSTYKIIFLTLGSTAIISTVGMVGLSALDKKIPPELNSIATAAIAGMAGILSPSPLFSKKD